ncbi:MAG: N-Acetyl-D-glucosamine ABC transport system, permease protein 1 [uncultured Thermomicrobiales bacterium]|uniref:N-Acetyl-D-glucosamine ABC transport system, permease protein 1 n=1 Tax=uncultured Thermomicrobiales bacterium TaxID=1645740 RepID=A0A6J4UXM5_9BACT|nr:MAG: N-Acetyl-D-glucosamine ABC transport system, permease protein 1 [uncultured Thermomicrobiales bacterium]
MSLRTPSLPAAPAGSPRVLAPSRGRAARRAHLVRAVTAYLFLLPALLAFALFAWYPIVRGLIVSFQEVNLVDPPRWVGLENFRQLIDDPLFVTAWANTLRFAGLGLLLGYAVPFVLALAINEVRHLRWYFRLAFYLPVVLPPIVAVYLWQWILDPGPGLANQILGWFGVDPQPWLQSSDTAMLSLVIVATWSYAGSTMLIYLAALQGVPAHLYDAAEVDGANLLRRLFDITLPQLRFILLIMLVLQIIGTMQVFTEPFVLTDGGPANATVTVLLLLYRYAFQYGNYGAASALGLMLFVVLVAFSLLYLWLTRRFRP